LALDIPFPSSLAYWLVTRPGAGAAHPAVSAFRSWIVQEAGKERPP
jgi:DNA-binding transcriptional LysR family regulator